MFLLGAPGFFYSSYLFEERVSSRISELLTCDKEQGWLFNNINPYIICGYRCVTYLGFIITDALTRWFSVIFS
jgi:hypothetical protein